MDIGELTRDQQFRLLDQLWEYLGRGPKALPLTDARRQELDRRLDDLDVEGPVGIPWDDSTRHPNGLDEEAPPA